VVGEESEGALHNY